MANYTLRDGTTIEFGSGTPGTPIATYDAARDPGVPAEAPNISFSAEPLPGKDISFEPAGNEFERFMRDMYARYGRLSAPQGSKALVPASAPASAPSAAAGGRALVPAGSRELVVTGGQEAVGKASPAVIRLLRLLTRLPVLTALDSLIPTNNTPSTQDEMQQLHAALSDPIQARALEALLPAVVPTASAAAVPPALRGHQPTAPLATARVPVPATTPAAPKAILGRTVTEHDMPSTMTAAYDMPRAAVAKPTADAANVPPALRGHHPMSGAAAVPTASLGQQPLPNAAKIPAANPAKPSPVPQPAKTAAAPASTHAVKPAVKAATLPPRDSTGRTHEQARAAAVTRGDPTYKFHDRVFPVTSQPAPMVAPQPAVGSTIEAILQALSQPATVTHVRGRGRGIAYP